MTDPPVTTCEIADLLRRICSLSDNPIADPAERAEILARKADLLARLANHAPTNGAANTPTKPGAAPSIARSARR